MMVRTANKENCIVQTYLSDYLNEVSFAVKRIEKRMMLRDFNFEKHIIFKDTKFQKHLMLSDFNFENTWH